MASRRDCRTGFIYSPALENFDFGKKHPIRVGRFKMVHDFLGENGFLSSTLVKEINPEPLPLDLLEQTHASEYLDAVRRISETGEGDIDIDTPGFQGIFDNARLAAGGTVTGIKAILDKSINHFLSPTGGFHHAKYQWGGGFCIFNDVASSVYLLKKHGIARILIADFDLHHGNGTQSYFYEDPGVMTVSFHEDPEWMYPHDGFIDDIGTGHGRGYNINMIFPMDSGDDVYKYAFDAIFPPLVEFYRPEFILFLPGFDTHYLDPLTHTNLTTDMIRYITEHVHNAAHKWADGRLGIMSGGGYNPDAFRWGVGAVMSVITGHSYEPPLQKPPFDEDDEETWDTVRENTGRVKDLIFPVLGI